MRAVKRVGSVPGTSQFAAAVNRSSRGIVTACARPPPSACASAPSTPYMNVGSAQEDDPVEEVAERGGRSLKQFDAHACVQNRLCR